MPFSLTGSQEAAVQAVLDDMAGDQRMLRLLQGDVGSGKTAVALMAMAASHLISVGNLLAAEATSTTGAIHIH